MLEKWKEALDKGNSYILEDRTKIPLTLIPLPTKIDTNQNFYSHLKHLCKKVANNELNALIRIIPYFDKKTNKSSL